ALEKALGAPNRPAKPYALFVGDLAKMKVMSSTRGGAMKDSVDDYHALPEEKKKEYSRRYLEMKIEYDKQYEAWKIRITEPSYRYFWSSHEELRDNYISRLMNISRFSWLLAHVHLNDNLILPRKGCDNYDKPHKIRPLIDKLRSSFRRTCKATKEQAVDESVYTGKLADTSEFGLGERVVIDLTTGLEGKNYHVYFDSFFSSENLMEKMKKNKLYGCGTVGKNRKGLPKFKAKKELRRGEEMTQINRKEKDVSDTQVTCPNVLVEYNKFKGCIDKAVKLISFYTIDRKSRNFSIGSQGFQFAWQSGTPSRSKGFEVSEHLPKRPQPQYMKFLNEKRKTLKAENPNWSRSEIFAACSKMWKEMSDEEKAKYPSPSKEELEEYKRKKEEYLMQLTPDELRSFDVVMMQKKAKEV
ncbi:hypothetical protein QYM36_000454, partial [Artemia franciscana]